MQRPIKLITARGHIYARTRERCPCPARPIAQLEGPRSRGPGSRHSQHGHACLHVRIQTLESSKGYPEPRASRRAPQSRARARRGATRPPRCGRSPSPSPPPPPPPAPPGGGGEKSSITSVVRRSSVSHQLASPVPPPPPRPAPPVLRREK